VIWLTWRQFRAQAIAVFGVVAVVAVALALTGPHLAHLYDRDVGGCAAYHNCDTARQFFLSKDLAWRNLLNGLVFLIPLVVGVFWGAPMVARELETGTFRMAWTQSVSRTRWLVTKLTLVGLAAMVATGLTSLAVTWWSSPFDRIGQNQYGTFDQRDLVPMAYALFAFFLGVTAGVLIRRTLPAMAATLVVFIVARVVTANWLRPRLLTPVHQVVNMVNAPMGFGSSNGGPFTLMAEPPNIPNAWISGARIVDQSGRTLSAAQVTQSCPHLAAGLAAGPPPPGIGQVRKQAPAGAADAMHQCLVTLSRHYHEVATYQPASRYWAFQWMEAGVFVVAALALAGFSVWWVRRRLT
jgi:hypothetical protein